ncbi:hypothetical protein [Polaribacter sargassicola]|uniref:hypothetical protein n=1 Tax=Polaribacter sargassicola TaxID=2836891 RepID=UPI001F355D7C|nr:hypothetical protein [Polaribacter sp. DS7-9]MCG1035082.1 hypothetical protein [Polaribacter sp. DS7-9]
MKKIILLFVLFCAFNIQAQYSGYGYNRQRQRQMMQPQTEQKIPEPDFPIEKYLGIVTYDIEKAAKKTGVKLSSKEGKEFSDILTKYNKDTKDIVRINSFLINSSKDMIDNFQKNARKTGDYSDQAKVQKKMIDDLKPFSKTLKAEDDKLINSMKNLLSEKKYNKWIKYNKKIYKFFEPELE